MDNTLKKVIMASAGTGKTYRLSLEFISILLKYKDYPDFNFSQIVVMTFTRKATAEIREKILDFLQELANDGKESVQIIGNLEKISAYKWQSKDRDYIKTKLLPEILQRKDLLQVSTIDSFTTNIFKSMIAPYLRIKEFSIDNNSNDEIMPLLLDFIFSQQIFPTFEPLLKRLNIRTVEDIQGFIKSLINNRWVLDYYDNDNMEGFFTKYMNLDKPMIEDVKKHLWDDFKANYLALVEEYNESVYEPQDKPWHKLLIADYKAIVELDENDKLNIVQVFEAILANPDKVIRNIKTFFDKPLPFSKTGKKVYKEITLDLEPHFTQALTTLLDYYLFSEIIPLQKEVLTGWEALCNHYDKLKFSLGKFTYNDITFYTYKYLYEESLSLIDREKGIVTNLFYEQLVSRIAFLLIDEFQDTSFNQFSILFPIITELISGYAVKDYSGVIIVGDPKQSIYSWRGGERGIMEIMPKILDDTKAEDLSQCYRSSRPVIDMVNRIFTNQVYKNPTSQEKIEWNYSPVRAKNWSADNNCYNEEKEEGGELFYWEYNSYSANKKASDEEDDDKKNDDNLKSYEVFAQEIKSLHQAGKIHWGETAILVRTHKNADGIANTLNKLGIPNNIESSGKLLEHKAVEVLLSILKFRLLEDRFSLLQILRSDLVLSDGNTLAEMLKIIHDNKADDGNEKLMTELSNFPECQKLFTLMNQNYSSQAHFITETLTHYDFSRICQNEIDWKNIYTFLEFLINFELAEVKTKTFDLYGFMEYCQEQVKTDSEILQEGLQLEDSISILTVHKSKGLGFKHVFLYWDLTNKKAPNKGDEFKLAYSFKENYSGLKDFVIYSSAMDEKVLKNSSENKLMQNNVNREIIEAIDVFYVALTRAEHSLGLFINYSKKDGFMAHIDSLKDETAIISQLVIAYKDFFRENEGENLSRENLAYFHYFKAGKQEKIEAKSDENDSNPEEVNYLQKYLTDYSQPILEENKPLENMKKVYLEDRHQLFGNAAHEFLTYVKYKDDCLTTSFSMVYRKFGSLLSHLNIIAVFHACRDFIKTNKEIFSPEWDKVFNEKTVFDNGKEYRIDRMMINTKRKEVMIIDYKTGGIHNKEQVNHYVEIIKKLPFVKDNGYKVSGKFIEVKVPAEGVEIDE